MSWKFCKTKALPALSRFFLGFGYITSINFLEFAYISGERKNCMQEIS
jgi:hypothetical protein